LAIKARQGDISIECWSFYVEPANRSHAVRFQFDQRVTARVALARVLWLQGLTSRALDEVRDTVAYALAIDHKLSLANVLAEAACPIALMAGELDMADRYIVLLQQETKAQSLDVWSTYADCFRGESLIARGQMAQGVAAIAIGPQSTSARRIFVVRIGFSGGARARLSQGGTRIGRNGVRVASVGEV